MLAVLLLLCGVLVASVTGRHRHVARQAREGYAAAKEKVPEARQALREASARSWRWTAYLVAGVVLSCWVLIETSH